MSKLALFPLGAVAGGLAAIFLMGPAAAEQATDACDSAIINEGQATQIATDLLSDLGYGTTPFSILRYSLKDVVCVNGQWRVSITMSQFNSRQKKGVVLVNCHTGEIEEV